MNNKVKPTPPPILECNEQTILIPLVGVALFVVVVVFILFNIGVVVKSI